MLLATADNLPRSSAAFTNLLWVISPTMLTHGALATGQDQILVLIMQVASIHPCMLT